MPSSEAFDLDPVARRRAVVGLLARGVRRHLASVRAAEFCARRSSRNLSELSPSELASEPHKSVNVTRS